MATAQEQAWDASTKYERTFLGHEFVARLAHDDSVVVDYLSVGPIKVHDCAPKKQGVAQIVGSHAAAIVIPVGKHVGEANDANQTEWDSVASRLNTTEQGRRGLYFMPVYSE